MGRFAPSKRGILPIHNVLILCVFADKDIILFGPIDLFSKKIQRL